MKIETYKKYEIKFNLVYVIIVTVIFLTTYGIENPNMIYGLLIAIAYSLTNEFHEFVMNREYSDHLERIPVFFTRFVHKMMKLFIIAACLVAVGAILISDVLWDLMIPIGVVAVMSLTISCKYSDIRVFSADNHSGSSSWYINRVNKIENRR